MHCLFCSGKARLQGLGRVDTTRIYMLIHCCLASCFAVHSRCMRHLTRGLIGDRVHDYESRHTPPQHLCLVCLHGQLCWSLGLLSQGCCCCCCHKATLAAVEQSHPCCMPCHQRCSHGAAVVQWLPLWLKQLMQHRQLCLPAMCNAYGWLVWCFGACLFGLIRRIAVRRIWGHRVP